MPQKLRTVVRAYTWIAMALVPFSVPVTLWGIQGSRTPLATFLVGMPLGMCAALTITVFFMERRRRWAWRAAVALAILLALVFLVITIALCFSFVQPLILVSIPVGLVFLMLLERLLDPECQAWFPGPNTGVIPEHNRVEPEADP